MGKLTINVESKSINGHPVTVLNLAGIVDGSTMTQLEEQFESLKRTGNNKFLFDCTNLEYISSAGIGFFMKEVDIINGLKGKLVLANLSPRVTRIFELLDLLEFFAITKSEDETTAAFSHEN